MFIRHQRPAVEPGAFGAADGRYSVATMAMDFEDYFNDLQQEIKAFRKGLTAESDRGSALFATAYLDKAISDLLYLSVVYEPKKVKKDLFDFNSPLGTFSSRIKMAYYLGKISKEVRQDLDLLRDIRNRFAHHPSVVSFDDEKIANKCRELQFSFREKKDQPRLHFLGSVFGVLAQIHSSMLTVRAPDPRLTDRPTEEVKTAHRAKLDLDE
ncbi:MAG: MltR family transcriptional regulator [Candidatus Accumulibacter meliphilus]|jgi:DNA-binding MltR family transcriptional regulator|uniref:MltR family transcriptional regulator n=1 Tax=Candidatus Accumulibacter meliphilus TaxID=2211374 RepID=UPI002FC282D1